MNKYFGIGLIVVLAFGLSSCSNQAEKMKMEQAKAIKSMVKSKLDSLTKEMSADCDRQIATAVKEKANAAAAATIAARPIARPAPKPAPVVTQPSSSGTSNQTSTVNNQKQGKIGSGAKTAGEKIKKTVNERFDAGKAKKGKVGKIK